MDAAFYAKMLACPVLAVCVCYGLKLFRQRLQLYKLHLVTVMVLAFFASMHPVENLQAKCQADPAREALCPVLWSSHMAAGFGLTFLGLLFVDYVFVENRRKPHAPQSDRAVLVPLKILIGASVVNALYALIQLLMI